MAFLFLWYVTYILTGRQILFLTLSKEAVVSSEDFVTTGITCSIKKCCQPLCHPTSPYSASFSFLNMPLIVKMETSYMFYLSFMYMCMGLHIYMYVCFIHAELGSVQLELQRL